MWCAIYTLLTQKARTCSYIDIYVHVHVCMYTYHSTMCVCNWICINGYTLSQCACVHFQRVCIHRRKDCKEMEVVESGLW